MRISISNIAWDTMHDHSVATLLKQLEIDAIDVAPSKYFSDFAKTTTKEITHVKDQWLRQNISIIGMQALLYGTLGLNVFGDKNSQSKMLQHLREVCRIAAGLNAKSLVFGSPKNRDRTGYTDQQTLDIAIPFFQELGNYAEDYEVIMCLEPNPPSYGANFMTTFDETAEIVRTVNHKAIKMQFDTGTLIINEDDPHVVLQKHADIIGHIHLSEPNLPPVGKYQKHTIIAQALKEHLPNQPATIEMTTPQDEQLSAIEHSIKFIIDNYKSRTFS